MFDNSMERKNLLSEIARFKIIVKKDYKHNLITKNQYELMHFELDSIIENLVNSDLLILTIKFHTIKSIYLIML